MKGFDADSADARITPFWLILGAALLVSIGAVWALSGLPLLTVAYAGGLATLLALGLALSRMRGSSSAT